MTSRKNFCNRSLETALNVSFRSIALFASAVVVLAALSGCTSFLGPQSIDQGHRPFNESVVSTQNEQLLLNLVRLKYRDNPYFIGVTSITSQTKFEGKLGASASTPFFHPSRISPNASLGYTDNPTVSYTPLQGQDFLNQMMSPIPMEAVAKLSQSGWSITRVLRVCVEQANDLRNAVSASGPTPEVPPEFLRFRDFTDSLREIQKNNGISIVREGERIALYFDPRRSKDSQVRQAIQHVEGTTSEGLLFLTNKAGRHHKKGELDLDVRSLIGVLFFLSHAIEVPEAHKDSGLVTITKQSDGSEFDWKRVSGDLLKVDSSTAKPMGAFVKIRYRGHWFYIRDNDLESKSTFIMLNQLFNLQAGDHDSASPVLTIPVG